MSQEMHAVFEGGSSPTIALNRTISVLLCEVFDFRGQMADTKRSSVANLVETLVFLNLMRLHVWTTLRSNSHTDKHSITPHFFAFTSTALLA